MPKKKASWKVEVFITLKPSVLDPQGATVQRELDALGYQGIQEVRLGKVIQLQMDGAMSQAVVGKQVETMCKKLLVNPVIEQSQIRIHAAPARSKVKA